MNLKPTILDRYILREFIVSFVAVMGFCTLLLLVATIFDTFGDILENDASFIDSIKYFSVGLPGKMLEVIPIASTLAVLFAIGALARTNEIIAMLTSGVHGLRLALPIAICGITIVAGTFVLGENIVPKLEVRRKFYEYAMLRKGTDKLESDEHVFAAGKDNHFYYTQLYSIHDKRMVLPLIVQVNESHTNAVQRIQAESAVWEKDNGDDTSSWLLAKPQIWNLNDEGHIISYNESKTTDTFLFEKDLATILAQTRKTDEMNYAELKDRVRILEDRNQPTFALRTGLLRKIAFPAGILFIMLIGFSYAVKTRAGTVMANFGKGMLWAFGYYMTFAVLHALGRAGSLPPFAAMIIPLIIFGAIAAYHLRKSYRWHA